MAVPESSVMTCLAKRHELRTWLKSNIAYQRLGPAGMVFEQLPASYTLQSCSAFNLVVGTHFARGAVSWRDASREGYTLAQNAVSAVAHLTGRKKSEAPSQPVMPQCMVSIVVEPVINPCEPAPGQPPSYEVTGYRLWISTACDPADLRAYLEKRRKLVSSSKQKDKGTKRMHDEEEEEPAAPAKRRRGQDGEPVAAPEADVAAVVPDSRLGDSFSPFAIGLRASHEDAHFLTKRVEAVRAKDAERRRTKKAAQSESNMPLVLQNVDVTAMTPFHYLEATSDLNFHLKTVLKYVAPHRVAVSSGNKASLSAGQFIDPRPFMTFTQYAQNELRMGIANRRHPLNPDNIFSKEAAMVYHTRQDDGKRLIGHRQTELAHYCNGVSPSPPPSPSLLLHRLKRSLTGVADGYMSPGEESQEIEGDLVEDNPAFATLMAQLETNDGGTPPPEALPFHNKLTNLIALKVPDTARLQFPFPALTRVLNPHMMSPECFGLLELPFPIGHRLTPREMETGERDTTADALADMAAHTKALAAYEDALNVDHRRRHPNAPKLGVVSALSASLVETDQRTDLETSLQMQKLPVPVLTHEHEVREIMDSQERTVVLAMEREAERTRSDPYQSLFRKVAEPESHNESMNISDFLPFAFAFRPDHVGTVRSHVESYLREKYYATMEALAPAERVSAEQELHAKTEDLVKQIAEKEVDDLAAYFVKHDDLLQMRLANQVRGAVSREMMKEEVRNLQQSHPDDYEAQCVKLRNLYHFDIVSNRIKNAEAVLTILRTSDNIADVLKAPDFRTWYLKNCTPKMMKALGADMPVMAQDAMPFNVCIQELADYAFGDLGIRTANGLSLFVVTFAAALDSQTWFPVRLLPCLSPVVCGPTATGKSFNTRGLERSMPPGIAQNMSTFSTQAFHTSTNNDNVFAIQEEGKASLLAPSDDDRKRGGSDALNLMKDLLTRFSATSKRATTNKETNVTSTTTALSSAHMSWLINSNLKTSYLDGPFSRRLIPIVIPALQGEASIQPEQLEELDMLRDDFNKRDSVKRMQITFAMYLTIRSMIKAGVLPAPDRTGANLITVAVLKELGVRADSTQLHHFLQFAENYQLYYAAYMVCWSPYQAYYHAKPDGAERWSGQAIIELASPFVIEVSTAPVVFALTALDFLLTPKYLDSFLRDLVDALQLARPEKRNYRRLDTVDRNAPPVYDPNYLVLEGGSWEGILETVADRNGMYKLRGDDIRNLLERTNTSPVTGKNFTALSVREDGAPLLIEEDPASDILSFTPFEFETNTRGPRGAKRSVLAVNIHFLVRHFKLDVRQPEQWVNMHQKPISVDENTFSMADADRIGRVTLESSPMARAIERVLSNKTTNKSPFDENGLPEQCYDFITAMAPLPVKLVVQVPTGRGQPPRIDEFRRGLDGIFMVQHLPRNEARDSIRRENAHVPTSTMAERLRLRRELYKKRQRAGVSDEEEEVDAEPLDVKRALMYTTSEYDGGYVLQTFCAKKHGLMLPLCFLRLFNYSEEEIDNFAKGIERVPETIPLGFGPLTYLLQRKICADMGYPVGKAVYPRDNIHQQLADAMFNHRFRLTPNGLHRREDMRRVVDFRDIADATPLGQVSFGDADREKGAEKGKITSFVNSVLDNAMDIDG